MKGLHVLVTRPHPQGEELCRQISAKGGHAIHFPTIAFKPLHVTIPDWSTQDFLIFISPQAVYSGIPHLTSLPNRAKWAAIGEGTAKAMKKAGFPVHIVPDFLWNSEGLLQLPEFQQVQGKNIAILRGAGGRELLDIVLIERGAKVTPIILYERIVPESDVSPCLKELDKIDMIVCTSFEAIRNLKIMLASAFDQLRGIPVIVVSERIKTLAEDLGFRRIWVTNNASDTDILNTIMLCAPGVKS